MLSPKIVLVCLLGLLTVLPFARPPDELQVSAQPPVAEWYMAGANPQRTSWVPAAVDPGAAASFGVLWYRPIEAYIGQHIQLVAGRGKIYVSTARGLYALDANSGETAWRYDTELPLGHSPTVVGDTVYVGGFDRRVYALDADTGAVRWIFDQAGAGFSTNPLVVEGKVLLGNRDGYFYALDATTGALAWRYPPAGQPPLGPILYSAAYQDGVAYFAANDNYAYALDAATGALRWRSDKLPGDGYQAWWPVVYKDLVIFSGAVAYRNGEEIGSRSVRHVIPPGSSYQIEDMTLADYIYGIQRDDLYYPGASDNELIGPSFAAGSAQDQQGINWRWRQGATVVDGHRITEYLEDDGQVRFDRASNKPWRRTTIALRRQDGTEFTFDSDGDGFPEPLPFVSVGTKSGNQYPPVLMPDKDGVPGELVYAFDFSRYIGGWGISRGSVMGWHRDHPRYLHLTAVESAIDEPMALSGAGDLFYFNLCCDRVASWSSLAQPDAGGTFWDYHRTLESLALHWATDPGQVLPYQYSLAPTYDEMWWESSMWQGLPRLYGGYGTLNSVYHNHGLQNPLIPYAGKLFTHRSNAIIALGPNPPEVPPSAQLPTDRPATEQDHAVYEAAVINLKKRPLLTFDHQRRDAIRPLGAPELKQRLEAEITKMLDAGHLRPGYYSIGQTGYSHLLTYFENPGDTLWALAAAYPHVSPQLQARLRVYLQQEYEHYFQETTYGRIGWYEDPVAAQFGQLAGREAMPLPPEVAEYIKSQHKSDWAGNGWPWRYPQVNFYALWKYAQLFPAEAPAIYAKILADNRLQLISQSQGEAPLPSNQELADNPWEHNAYIAGYIGFLNLQQMAGRSNTDAALRNQVETELQRLLVLRATTFAKDQPWVGARLSEGGGVVHRRIMSVARNFLYLTPELGTYLRTHALAKVQEAVDEYNWVAPYWFVARYEASVSEGVQHQLYDYAALFQAKAYILQEPQADLVKYLDVPAFAVGDLFYIQNLVAALEAGDNGSNPGGTPTPSATPGDPNSTPTPTPTVVPTEPGGPASRLFLPLVQEE